MQIYDSLTQKKLPLETIEPNKVKLYVCGSTVYDDCHIGHGRTYTAFDVVIRYLRFRGYEVTYVRNITDIDDKIINRANDQSQSCEALVETYIKRMHDDFDQLNLLRPDFEPRATDTVEEIVQMIASLIDKGYAYSTDKGDVYFRVGQFKDYGKLSKQSIEHLRQGVRFEVDEQKEDALDFALWKSAKPNEPAWESPWSMGRPGWHIECSAMTKKCLGDTFDIHAGGNDLKFPHHENEIAQSEANNGCTFARFWMHAGMVNINEEKMSKSLNNFFTIREVLAEFDAEVVRFFLLAGHYRSIINYSKENLENAQSALTRLYTAIRGLLIDIDKSENHTVYEEAFITAMDDDFNTPEALSQLFVLAKEINRLKADKNYDKAQALGSLLVKLGSILGILQKDPEVFFHLDSELASEIEALILRRNNAREERNWAEADRIRDKLTQMDITLEDTAEGTIWRKN
ncbi:cysteine--tRNA ligase [Thiotrichales bacterium 19S3-7]|nr:cysteine--tRNA ligase [Thiotrichales bacterium 19S3-7]MCF6801957.1 cysteine--tRNA ligase [Thiotrichales bacterium 19S3-11]